MIQVLWLELASRILILLTQPQVTVQTLILVESAQILIKIHKNLIENLNNKIPVSTESQTKETSTTATMINTTIPVAVTVQNQKAVTLERIDPQVVLSQATHPEVEGIHTGVPKRAV